MLLLLALSTTIVRPTLEFTSRRASLHRSAAADPLVHRVPNGTHRFLAGAVMLGDRSVRGRKGAEAAAQKLVDNGDAATLEEAYSLQGRRGAEAAAQSLVDSGDAATLEEARSLLGRMGAKAAAQKLVDSGDAARSHPPADELTKPALTQIILRPMQNVPGQHLVAPSCHSAAQPAAATTTSRATLDDMKLEEAG